MVPCNHFSLEDKVVSLLEVQWVKKRSLAKARIMARYPCECTYRSTCARHSTKRVYFDRLLERYLRVLERNQAALEKGSR